MATAIAADRPCAGRAGQTCLHGSSHYAAEPGTMKSEAGGCGGGGDYGDDEFGTFVAAGDRVEWEEFGVCQREETGNLRPQWDSRTSSPSPGAGWRAFTNEDEDTLQCHSLQNRCIEAHSHAPRTVPSPEKGQWWFGEGAEQQRLKTSCPIQRSSPQHKDSQDSQSSLRNIFENCFPPEPLTLLQEEVQPLEVLLSSQAKTRGSGPHLRQAACLFKSLMDQKHVFDFRTKWSESYSQKAYMEVLHIDRTTKIHPTKPKPFVDSSNIAKKIEGRKLLVASTGYDKELKLTKVTDSSIPVNGFSPSHHLQTFFQQWMQSSGKKKLKMAYDFNRSLLV